MKISKIKISLLSLVFALGLTACGNENADNTDQPSQAIETTENDNQELEDNTNESTEPMENTEDNQAEQTTIEVEKPEEEQAPSEETTDQQAPDNSDSLSNDGSYVGTLMTEANGERNPEFEYATIANASVSDGKLIVNGSLDYRQDPNNYEDVSELSNTTHEFVLSSDTVFQAVGGMAEPETFTPEEFSSYYEGVKDSGLALVIEVIDGVVKTVSISS